LPAAVIAAIPTVRARKWTAGRAMPVDGAGPRAGRHAFGCVTPLTDKILGAE